jgi:quercetin dioxygenase-like cupin family protein
MNRFVRTAGMTLALGVAGSTGAFIHSLVAEQAAPPTENRGVAAKVVAAVDLGPEIQGMQGRQLRMRVITLEPGGVFAIHNHKNRPSVEYIVRGEATEFAGNGSRTYREGEAFIGDRNTEHWWRNDGKITAVFIAVDILQTQ